ncbi:hypothetical protein ACIBEA_43885 [Streptomyces sp. NPDC051555]|uniref:hypothetical protein n=1 Tax=Streptomyces sp. NPDC051555 TaxID=3365657 RepID=UPI003797C27B
MTEQHPTGTEGLRAVAAALLVAFENLGAEHEALTEEEKATTAKERQGTVRRMIQSIVDADRTLAHSVDLVATVYGMRALCIRGQMTKGADGGDYRPLLSLGNPDEVLYETASYLQVVVQRLGEAYEPTKKYPGLAVARRPQEMRTVLSSLGAALAGLCAEMITIGLSEDPAEFDSCLAFLDELESRTCRLVPPQATGPTADDVTAAILASPEIARAAAAALKRATA